MVTDRSAPNRSRPGSSQAWRSSRWLLAAPFLLPLLTRMGSGEAISANFGKTQISSRALSSPAMGCNNCADKIKTCNDCAQCCCGHDCDHFCVGPGCQCTGYDFEQDKKCECKH
jgi:hypothetical protein